MRKFLYILFLSLLLMSCKVHEYVEVPIETIKTEYVYTGRVDSILVKDSVDRYINGDTVILYKNHIQYRYLNRTDTIVRTDTIPKIVEVKVKETVEVNHIKWYQETLMWIGGLAILISVLYLFYIIKMKKKWTSLK